MARRLPAGQHWIRVAFLRYHAGEITWTELARCLATLGRRVRDTRGNV